MKGKLINTKIIFIYNILVVESNIYILVLGIKYVYNISILINIIFKLLNIKYVSEKIDVLCGFSRGLFQSPLYKHFASIDVSSITSRWSF